MDSIILSTYTKYGRFLPARSTAGLLYPNTMEPSSISEESGQLPCNEYDVMIRTITIVKAAVRFFRKRSKTFVLYVRGTYVFFGIKFIV
jgi:hypothetical protein